MINKQVTNMSPSRLSGYLNDLKSKSPIDQEQAEAARKMHEMQSISDFDTTNAIIKSANCDNTGVIINSTLKNNPEAKIQQVIPFSYLGVDTVKPDKAPFKDNELFSLEDNEIMIDDNTFKSYNPNGDLNYYLSQLNFIESKAFDQIELDKAKEEEMKKANSQIESSCFQAVDYIELPTYKESKVNMFDVAVTEIMRLLSSFGSINFSVKKSNNNLNITVN